MVGTNPQPSPHVPPGLGSAAYTHCIRPMSSLCAPQPQFQPLPPPPMPTPLPLPMLPPLPSPPPRHHFLKSLPEESRVRVDYIQYYIRPTGEIQATFLALYLKFVNTEVGQSCSEKSSGIHDKDYHIMIAYVLEVLNPP